MRSLRIISICLITLLASTCAQAPHVSRKHHAGRRGEGSNTPHIPRQERAAGGASKQPSEEELETRTDELLKQVASENYKDRERATSQLKKMLIEVPVVLSILKQELEDTRDPEVRQRLERILKPYAKWGITGALLRQFPDIIQRLESKGPKVRCKIATALGVRKAKGGVGPLIRLLKDKAYIVRSTAAEALGEIGDRRAVGPLIEELKQSQAHMSISVSAAEALGKIGDERAVEPLIAALKNRHSKGWTLPAYAARALGRIGDKRAVEPLKELRQRDIRGVGTDARIGAAYALVKITGDKQALEFLVKSMKHENKVVGRWAAEALAETADKRVVEPMMEALRHDRSDVRACAATVLAQIPDLRAVEPLVQALKDENWYVRCKAAEGLGEIGDKRAVGALMEAFGDEETYVRTFAAESLGKIGKPAVEPLERLLKETADGRNRVRAAYALARITGNKDARELVIRALGDEDWDIRRFAAYVLKDVGGRAAVELLINALKDEDGYVSLYASQSLEKITNQYFGEDYEKWKQWYEEEKKE